MATFKALISRQHDMHHHALFLFSSSCEYGLEKYYYILLIIFLLSFYALFQFYITVVYYLIL